MVKRWFANSRLLLLLVVLVAAILRSVNLMVTPPALYLDEVSIAYNAWSIVETGADEHGQPWPRLFKAYGEYKQPVYIYATAFWILLGIDPTLAVRVTSLVAGVITVALIYGVSSTLASRIKGLHPTQFGLWSAFALAIMPWHIHFSRAGFEATLALMLLVASVWIILSSRHWAIVSVGISLSVLSMATYNANRVIVPLLMLLLFWWLKPKVSIATLLGVLAMPVMVALLMWPALFSSASIARFDQTSAISTTPLISWVETLTRGVVAHLDTTFLFFRGDQDGRHSVRHLGMLLPSDVLILVVALLWLRNRPRVFVAGAGLLTLSILPAALTTPVPHGLRSFSSVIIWAMVLAIGYYQIFGTLGTRMSWKWIKATMITALVAFYLSYYLAEYHYRYRRITALDWSNGIRETVEAVAGRYQQYDLVYITPPISPLELALYLPIPPNDFQQLAKDQDSFTYGPIRFVEIAWMATPPPGSKALVAAPASQVAEFAPLEFINLVNGDQFMALWERGGLP